VDPIRVAQNHIRTLTSAVPAQRWTASYRARGLTDVSGALRAGCKAAFVARPGMVSARLGRNIIGPEVDSVVEQILVTDVR
jgi:hypothetical protein